MKYYALGHIDVTDPAWVREHVALVQRRDGRYLARAAVPAATGQPELRL